MIEINTKDTISKSKTSTCFTIMFFIITFIVLLLSLIRLFFGVELTDEIFTLSEANLILQGSVPYVNNWSQTPGFSIFTTWIIQLHKSLFNTFEGIFLYTRLINLIYRILKSIIIVMLLHDILDYKEYKLSVFALIVPIYFHFPNFTYNSLGIELIGLTGIYIFWILQDINKRNNHFYNIGIILALSVYGYPASIIATVYFAIIILLLSRKYLRISFLAKFISGGFILTITIILWMLIVGGGFDKLLFGLDSVLNYNPYFELGNNPIFQSIKLLFDFSKNKLIIYFILFYILKIFHKKKPKHISIQTFDFFFLLIIMLYDFTNLNGIELLYSYGISIFIFYLIRFREILSHKKLKSLFVIAILPVVITSLFTGLFAYGSIEYRMIYITQTAFFLIVYFIELPRYSKNSKTLIILILTLLHSAILIKSNYNYIYRDKSIENLTSKVESGIYKGIYTTKNRSQSIQLIEEYLNKKFKANDKVLFMEVVPFAYLMSNSLACTPSTWDMSLYSYGFNDDSLYQRYFKTAGCKPDFIIYIDTQRDKTLSINREDYNFTIFVNQNYVLQESFYIDSTFRVFVYRSIF